MRGKAIRGGTAICIVASVLAVSPAAAQVCPTAAPTSCGASFAPGTIPPSAPNAIHDVVCPTGTWGLRGREVSHELVLSSWQTVRISLRTPTTDAWSGILALLRETAGGDCDTVTAISCADAHGLGSTSAEVIVETLPPGRYFVVVDVGYPGSLARDYTLSVSCTAFTPPVCGNGVVEGGEACDAGSANGMSACGCQTGCVYTAAGAACGAAPSGACDEPDTCDGAGACVDRVRAGGTVCRSAAAACDVAERCDGASRACPADALATAGTPCRPAAAPCDIAEACDGIAAACPVDSIAPAGTVCRPSAGACDVEEACSGSAALCPMDRFVPAGTLCRAATGSCDLPESCPGSSRSCPFDGFLPNGTSCADSVVCDGDEVCASGSCVSGAALSCDDGDACTADSCAEPSGCAHAAVSGCCNEDSQCDDGEPCTADVCSGAGGTCSHPAIAECCTAGGDCDDADPCTTDACDAGAMRCTHDVVAGCCALDADCDDGDACTSDTCAGGACASAAIPGCCASDADCDDSDACTADECVERECRHAPACDGGVDAGLALDASSGRIDAGPEPAIEAGCACRAVRRRSAGSTAWLAALALLLGVRRARSRRGGR